jgi:hypothetical protein
MISRLQNGDILISFDEPCIPEADSHLLENLASTSDHSMVYKNNNVYHSSRGTYQTGVRNHAITKLINPEIDLGSCMIIRIKDEKTRELLAAVVERWGSNLTPEQLQKRPKDNKTVILSTPFTNFFERKADAGSPEENKRYELYRAFRAYMRNNASPILPLSKSKGVSCGNFLSYSMKVAIISRLFPDGIPKKIQDAFNAIEKIKTDNKHSKLSQINKTAFDDFEKVVVENLPSSAELDPFKKTYIDYLYSRVKNAPLDQVVTTMLSKPDSWSFAGYLTYYNSKKPSPDKKDSKQANPEDTLEPSILSYENCVRLTKMTPDTAHSCTVSHDELQHLNEEPSASQKMASAPPRPSS